MITTTTEQTLTPEKLANLGNVPATYRHEWRETTSQEPLLLPESIFKWYHVHRASTPVPTDIEEEARELVAEAMATSGWDSSYGLNFAMLHVSTEHAFLLCGVWRGHQELWERIYYRELADGASFHRTDMGGEDAPLGCVWELGVTCHERMAWHRYLFTERTDADKRAWLNDLYEGRV